MKRKEFIQADVQHRYLMTQQHGIKLMASTYNSYLAHLYKLDDFYVELLIDPVKYSLVSAEIVDETHLRYKLYLQKISCANK